MKEDCNAGSKPNNSPVSSASAKLKPSTRQSKLTVKKLNVCVYALQNCVDCVSSLGRMRMSNVTPQRAKSAPNAPPASASSRLSVRSWRSNRCREAPSAARKANSRCRATARASCRFVTFAQAISNTSPTAANSSRNEVLSADSTLAACSGERDAVFQTSHDLKREVVRVGEYRADKSGTGHHRQPNVCRAALPTKAGRQHANDGERLFVQFDDLAEHLRVAAITPLPEAVTQHRRRARVFLRERTPNDGVDTEQLEVAG